MANEHSSDHEQRHAGAEYRETDTMKKTNDTSTLKFFLYEKTNDTST